MDKRTDTPAKAGESKLKNWVGNNLKDATWKSVLIREEYPII